jgi:hypothetical protein
MATKRGPKNMSAEHKAALAAGRNLSRPVNAYLEALETRKPRRGRKRTPDSVNNRLARIETELADAGPLQRVKLIQERINLQAELARMDEMDDISELEAGFVANAAAYSEKQGITYAAWREMGIAPDVLKAAGISR